MAADEEGFDTEQHLLVFDEDEASVPVGLVAEHEHDTAVSPAAATVVRGRQFPFTLADVDLRFGEHVEAVDVIEMQMREAADRSSRPRTWKLPVP